MAQEESMFGPTPLAIQDQLDSQFIKQNSSLDLGNMSARAGLALGNGINGLLGREDPRVRQAKTMEEVKNELRQEGVDPSQPDEFYPALIKKLNSKGLTEQAMSAANAYRAQGLSSAKTASEIGKNNAAAYASMREKLSPLGKLQAEYADAVARGDDKKAKELQDAINLANQGNLEKTVEGVPGKEGWQREVLRSRDGKLVHEGEPYKKAPLIDQSSKTEGQFYLEAGKDALKKWNEGQQAYVKLQSPIQQLTSLLKEDLTLGSGANLYNEALRIANTFGIGTEEAKKLIDSNDALSSLAIRVVLPKMKELGGSDSNEELKQLLASGPNAKVSKEALLRQIKWFYQDAANHAKIKQAAAKLIKEGAPPQDAWAAAMGEVDVVAPEGLDNILAKPTAQPTQPKPPAKPALKTPPGVDIEAAKAQYRAHLGKIAKEKGWTQEQLNAVIKKNLGE